MRFLSIRTLLTTAYVLANPCPAEGAPSAQRVQQLLGDLASGDFTDFFALFRPESTWNTIGFGVRDREEMIAIFAQIDCLLGNPPLKIETDVIISQDRSGPFTSVQAHVPNGIIGTNGVQYNQTYSWLIEWKGETIISNTEYLNNFLAADLLGDNPDGC